MERVSNEQTTPRKENKNETLALVLIGIGLFWLLKQTGLFFHFQFFHLNHILEPIRHSFHSFGHFIFSWPMILIIIGLVLVAGKRSGGLVLLIIGGIFIIPKIFILTGVTIVFLFPVILIVLGIALIARLI